MAKLVTIQCQACGRIQKNIKKEHFIRGLTYCVGCKSNDMIIIEEPPFRYHNNLLLRPKVTVIMPVVARPKIAGIAIQSILDKFEFPYNFIVIIRPHLQKAKKSVPRPIARRMRRENPLIRRLVDFCRVKNIAVVRALYYPSSRVWNEMVKMCNTKYLFKIDSDFKILYSIEPMLNFIENHPNVGVCGTSIFTKGKAHSHTRYGANLRIKNGRFGAVRCYPPNKPPKEPYHYCDHVHFGSVLIRMRIFEDIAIDKNFYRGMGGDHYDFFLQLKQTNWKVVSYNACASSVLAEKGVPDWYRLLKRFRSKKTTAYLEKKWRFKF